MIFIDKSTFASILHLLLELLFFLKEKCFFGKKIFLRKMSSRWNLLLEQKHSDLWLSVHAQMLILDENYPDLLC